MARVLTLARLVKAGACQPQVDLFKQHFGKSVEVTEEVCLAHASEFSWGWAANHFLTPSALDAYDAARAPAWAAYDAAQASAWAAYNAAMTPWVAYDAARASAWVAYDAARASAWVAYDAAVAPARAAYDAARASAFAAAYNS